MKLEKSDNLIDLDYLVGDEFLQSKFWADLLIKGGETIERWNVIENNKILATGIFIRKLLFGSFYYYYSPRGPRGEERAIEFLLNELKKEKRGSVFFRIETEKKLEINLKKSTDLQPRKTLMLDLNLSEEELLKEMHQKTRYNIKLADKKGVEISEGTIDDFKEFWRLMSVTGNRDGFRLHSEAHYRNLLSYPEFIKIYFARHDGKYMATGLFSFFAGRVTYLHGASDNEVRNLMAPYLLQWEIIKQAQKEGYKYYDFYGVDEKKWPGVTRFKIGFGGFIKEYSGTHDLVIRPVLYGLYELMRKLRRMIKGLI